MFLLIIQKGSFDDTVHFEEVAPLKTDTLRNRAIAGSTNHTLRTTEFSEEVSEWC